MPDMPMPPMPTKWMCLVFLYMGPVLVRTSKRFAAS